MEKITLAALRDLKKQEFKLRYGKEKARPPRLVALAAFIEAQFPDVTVSLEDWSYSPYRMFGRLRHPTGKTRRGKRLAVYSKDATSRRFTIPIYTYNPLEPYHTTWDVVGWIVARADEQAQGDKEKT